MKTLRSSGSPAARRLAWGLAAAAAAINALAYVLSLYELAWFDEALHAFTLFALTFIAAQILHTDLPRAALRYWLLVTAAGLALGTLWEIAEWVFDAFSERNTILGKADTMTDLALDGAGAALAGLLALRMRR